MIKKERSRNIRGIEFSRGFKLVNVPPIFSANSRFFELHGNSTTGFGICRSTTLGSRYARLKFRETCERQLQLGEARHAHRYSMLPCRDLTDTTKRTFHVEAPPSLLEQSCIYARRVFRSCSNCAHLSSFCLNLLPLTCWIVTRREEKKERRSTNPVHHRIAFPLYGGRVNARIVISKMADPLAT